jgi:hypothetical protein
MLKKLLSWDDILVSLLSWRLQIPNLSVINPLQALVHPPTQKNYPAWIVNPNPNFSKFAFFGKLICRLEMVDFNLPSNWWVSQLQISEFAILVLGFEKLGLELDNCGQTTKKRLLSHLYSMVNPISVLFLGACWTVQSQIWQTVWSLFHPAQWAGSRNLHFRVS